MANTRSLQQPSSMLQALFVLACMLVALYLRLDFYPGTYYSDEEIPIAVIKHMEVDHSLDTNWARGIWRNAGDRWAFSYDQYNFSSYNSALYYLNQLAGVTAHDINPAKFNRISSVVFQLLALILIFYATNYFVGIFGAITATLFFVFNPLLVVDAHYARPESFLILITALAIFFHLLAVKKKYLHYFWVSLFFWGIACACKFSLLPMAALAILHIYFQNKKISARTLALLFFLVGVFILAPYLFIHNVKVAHGVISLFKQYFNATSASTLNFQRSDWLLPKYLLGYFGAAFWLMLPVALLSENTFHKCLAKFLLAAVLFYIAIFSLLSFFNESNLSHLAFAWCLLLAIATETCIARVKQKTTQIKTAYAVLVIALLATPALCSVQIRKNIYNPSAAAALQETTLQFEQNLQARYPEARITDIVKHPELLQTPNTSMIIKAPWMPRQEYEQLHQELLSRHFILIDEMKLPLSELPHSQLQSIHFPAAYRYYQLHP